MVGCRRLDSIAFLPVEHVPYQLNHPHCMRMWDSPLTKDQDHKPQRIEMTAWSNRAQEGDKNKFDMSPFSHRRWIMVRRSSWNILWLMYVLRALELIRMRLGLTLHYTWHAWVLHCVPYPVSRMWISPSKYLFISFQVQIPESGFYITLARMDVQVEKVR